MSWDCEWCGKRTDEEELIINFGVCDPCLDASLEEYFESTAGPLDWVLAP